MSDTPAASPKYRLLYYPIRGRGEILRLIFVHSKIPYKDVRISPEEWAKIKPDSPFGVIPIIEFVDSGKRLSSSLALARYFGEEHGLAGSSPLDNAELCSIADACNDAWIHIYAATYFEKNEQRKAMLTKTLLEDYLPPYISRLERRAAANGAKEGWIFGDKLTYADFAVYLLYQFVTTNIQGADEQYPILAQLLKSVEGLESIAKWLKERTVTPF